MAYGIIHSFHVCRRASRGGSRRHLKRLDSRFTTCSPDPVLSGLGCAGRVGVLAVDNGHRQGDSEDAVEGLEHRVMELARNPWVVGDSCGQGDEDVIGLTSRHISHMFGPPFESCFVPITSKPCRR